MGTLFKKDDGNLVIKLDGIPLGTDFNGWVNLDFDDEANRPQPLHHTQG